MDENINKMKSMMKISPTADALGYVNYGWLLVPARDMTFLTVYP